MPTETASEFLEHCLQPMMRSGMSYIKNANDYFLSKLKHLKKVLDNVVLVTTNFVGLYPGIPYNEGLQI